MKQGKMFAQNSSSQLIHSNFTSISKWALKKKKYICYGCNTNIYINEKYKENMISFNQKENYMLWLTLINQWKYNEKHEFLQ